MATKQTDKTIDDTLAEGVKRSRAARATTPKAIPVKPTPKPEPHLKAAFNSLTKEETMPEPTTPDTTTEPGTIVPDATTLSTAEPTETPVPETTPAPADIKPVDFDVIKDTYLATSEADENPLEESTVLITGYPVGLTTYTKAGAENRVVQVKALTTHLESIKERKETIADLESLRGRAQSAPKMDQKKVDRYSSDISNEEKAINTESNKAKSVYDKILKLDQNAYTAHLKTEAKKATSTDEKQKALVAKQAAKSIIDANDLMKPLTPEEQAEKDALVASIHEAYTGATRLVIRAGEGLYELNTRFYEGRGKNAQIEFNKFVQEEFGWDANYKNKLMRTIETRKMIEDSPLNPEAIAGTPEANVTIERLPNEGHVRELARVKTTNGDSEVINCWRNFIAQFPDSEPTAKELNEYITKTYFPDTIEGKGVDTDKMTDATNTLQNMSGVNLRVTLQYDPSFRGHTIGIQSIVELDGTKRHYVYYDGKVIDEPFATEVKAKEKMNELAKQVKAAQEAEFDNADPTGHSSGTPETTEAATAPAPTDKSKQQAPAPTEGSEWLVLHSAGEAPEVVEKPRDWNNETYGYESVYGPFTTEDKANAKVAELS